MLFYIRILPARQGEQSGEATESLPLTQIEKPASFMEIRNTLAGLRPGLGEVSFPIPPLPKFNPGDFLSWEVAFWPLPFLLHFRTSSIPGGPSI
jgi:hypothetical protein